MLTHDDKQVDWDLLIRDALVVPESSPLPKMLKTFQESHRHLAIVVDEYGGVEGIATLEDVLEEIVGEIVDESDRPTKNIMVRKDGALFVKAAVDLRKLSAKLGIAWEPEGEVSTVGGLVTETLERIPAIGESIEWQGYRIGVLRADPHRVTLLSVRKLPED